jgi:ATP-dependent exoDNAse (exonuclease V) beta subunit
VNLMTVHAAKGLEFPIVFLVNLGRGVSARRTPIHVIPDRGDGVPSVTVWPFRSDAEDDERLRDLEESKRLLYVAMTRARDRLYLSAVVAENECQARRGSLAEVLPASLRTLLASAAQALPSVELVRWRASNGRHHAFRVCCPEGGQAPGTGDRPRRLFPFAAASVTERPEDRLGPLTVDPTMAAVPVTTLVASSPDDVAGTRTHGDESGLLLGRLVHRLLQAGSDESEVDRLRVRARELLEHDGTAEPAVSGVTAERAAGICAALRQRRDVLALLNGDCLFEVPFSMKINGDGSPADDLCGAHVPTPAPVIVRGSIDCLVRDGDGRVVVVEFKTGARQPQDEAQLALYIKAAKALFPSADVEGQLIYA